jgi:glycosyltransferase involved in cell wall biosynthesis
MRILVVHNRYRSGQPSGENRVVEQEVSLLRGAGNDVVLYERRSDDISGFSIIGKAAVPARVVWSPADRRRLGGVLAHRRPDVVHVHNTFPLISPSILSVCREAGVPVVATLHNFRLACANGLLFRSGAPCEDCVGRNPWPGVVHGCYRGSRLATIPVAASISVHRGLRTWSRGVSRFVALSTFARDRLIAGGLPAKRMVVKPNSTPDPGERRAAAGEHFLYLGRLSDEKGVDLLASGWSDDLGRLVVVGDGPARPALERSLARYTSVLVAGQLSHDESMRLLLRSTALIVPSRWYEGFPMVVVEACARGIPVIAPAHGGFPEMIEDGRSGVLFPPGDAAGLAQAVRALRTPETSGRMGRHARAIYERRYTEERNLDRLMGIYAGAIEASEEGASERGAPRVS